MGQTLSEPIVEKTSHKEKNKELMYGVSCMQGWRLTMEDAHTTLLKLEDSDTSFFGVYDGHGGSTIAQYTGQALHLKLHESEHFKKKEYKEALKDAYLSLDKELKEDQNFAYDPSGCTAVSVLVTPDKKLYCANAGDSRAIISVKGKSKALSYDHKPVDPLESERIISAGGFVEYGRVNGNLALSRAIGDFEFKQSEDLPAEEQIVTCNPDIIEHVITDDDEFFVLACDGIWDCMTNQQVVDFICNEIIKRTPLDEICESAMDHCLAPDSGVGNVGCDNMSIMIIAMLNGKTEDEWYDWMIERISKNKKTDALGNTISSESENEEGQDAKENDLKDTNKEDKKDEGGDSKLREETPKRFEVLEKLSDTDNDDGTTPSTLINAASDDTVNDNKN
ncbi:phosphatase 2C-like domain-containing protein [Radiomyces spectabilis]|uniref:phosphatase 2C-like domain-containing protein n=1 Tax=Radiomyces spectabilis TaxID=64574 RepID=UPI00221FE4F2|nr:phosphatase 2C-like domain-containing protein [Radiomyces spectabilis]KAI8373089.1 phosphatase 2C-like domain-containing protein [Radiomyces spectabilis]